MKSMNGKMALALVAGMAMMREELTEGSDLGGSTAADTAAAAAETTAGDAAAPADTKKVIGADVPVPAGYTKQVFHFKKEAVKDAQGNKLGEGKKLPSVALMLPEVTGDTINAIFANPERVKEQTFVLDQLAQAVYLGARDQINVFRDKNSGQTVPLDVLDYSKLTLAALAAIAEESGSSSKLSDDDWNSFYDDWAATMKATEWTTDARDDKVDAQIGFFKKNLRRTKDKKMLGVIKQLLSIYATSTTSEALAENAACYENISSYVDKWLAYEPEDVLKSIFG